MAEEIITGSPTNRYNYLVALPLSDPSEEFLQLSNDEIPDFPIVFWHSKEAHTELDIDRGYQAIMISFSIIGCLG